jgi:hypothetical protein
MINENFRNKKYFVKIFRKILLQKFSELFEIFRNITQLPKKNLKKLLYFQNYLKY